MSDYTYRGTLTLKNRFSLVDFDELQRAETDYAHVRRMEIEAGFGPERDFNANYLKAIHRYLFQDVYEWAGHTRDERVELSDGTTAYEPIMRKTKGQPFAVGPEIPAALGAFAKHLHEADYFRGLPREQFAARAADAMAELNTIHPFREGNGRTQRVFMEQLAQAAGHNLDFTVVSKERMIQASVEAHEANDSSMMRRMFEEISDPERSALLRHSIEQLEELNFDWNDRYVATLTPTHSVSLIFAGVSGDQFMARTGNAILFGRTEDLPEPRPARGETFTYGEDRQTSPRIERLSENQESAARSNNEQSSRNIEVPERLDLGAERKEEEGQKVAEVERTTEARLDLISGAKPGETRSEAVREGDASEQVRSDEAKNTPLQVENLQRTRQAAKLQTGVAAEIQARQAVQAQMALQVKQMGAVAASDAVKKNQKPLERSRAVETVGQPLGESKKAPAGNRLVHEQRNKKTRTDRPGAAKTSTFKVSDKMTGLVSGLGDFMTGFLANLGGSSAPEQPREPQPAGKSVAAFLMDPAERKRQQLARVTERDADDRDHKALLRMGEDVKAGKALSSSDISNLTRAHQDQIAHFGDDAVRRMVEDARRREEERARGGRERERD